MMQLLSKIQPQKAKTKREQIAEWRETIPEKYRGTYDRAMAGKSRQKAIFAKCQDCMCWQVAEIRRCTVVTCPLHPYRPGSKASAQIDASESGQNEETLFEGGSGPQET